MFSLDIAATRRKRGLTYYPSLAKWPKISKRMIKKVGLAVLNILVSR
jgi:hypothetical protein